MTDVEKTSSDLANLNIDDASSDRKILIAVDFGTTFSGVAWAQTRRVRETCTPNKFIFESNT